jgi:hypothetical protein
MCESSWAFEKNFSKMMLKQPLSFIALKKSNNFRLLKAEGSKSDEYYASSQMVIFF